MTSFVLKIIALITMFIDHISYPLYGGSIVLNSIGRVAFPIFAFQISEGFIHTKNIKKYLLRLGIFAIISQVPFQLFHFKFIDPNTIALNVFFTLFFGLLSICIFDYIKNCFKKMQNYNKNLHLDLIFGLICTVLIAIVAEFLNTDYGFWGVIVVFMFYFFKENKLAMIISFITLCIIKYGIQIIDYGFSIYYVIFCLCTILPIIFISLYKGKQGKKIKYLLYFFYPAHLLLLYLIF